MSRRFVSTCSRNNQSTTHSDATQEGNRRGQSPGPRRRRPATTRRTRGGLSGSNSLEKKQSMSAMGRGAELQATSQASEEDASGGRRKLSGTMTIGGQRVGGRELLRMPGPVLQLCELCAIPCTGEDTDLGFAKGRRQDQRCRHMGNGDTYIRQGNFGGKLEVRMARLAGQSGLAWKARETTYSHCPFQRMPRGVEGPTKVNRVVSQEPRRWLLAHLLFGGGSW